MAGAIDHNLLFVLAVPFLLLGYALWLGRSLGWRLPRVAVPAGPLPALVVLAWPSPWCATCPSRATGFLGSDIGLIVTRSRAPLCVVAADRDGGRSGKCGSGSWC